MNEQLSSPSCSIQVPPQAQKACKVSVHLNTLIAYETHHFLTFCLCSCFYTKVSLKHYAKHFIKAGHWVTFDQAQ